MPRPITESEIRINHSFFGLTSHLLSASIVHYVMWIMGSLIRLLAGIVAGPPRAVNSHVSPFSVLAGQSGITNRIGQLWD